jgi:hypothetical protein
MCSVGIPSDGTKCAVVGYLLMVQKPCEFLKTVLVATMTWMHTQMVQLCPECVLFPLLCYEVWDMVTKVLEKTNKYWRLKSIYQIPAWCHTYIIITNRLCVTDTVPWKILQLHSPCFNQSVIWLTKICPFSRRTLTSKYSICTKRHIFKSLWNLYWNHNLHHFYSEWNFPRL